MFSPSVLLDVLLNVFLLSIEFKLSVDVDTDVDTDPDPELGLSFSLCSAIIGNVDVV